MKKYFHLIIISLVWFSCKNKDISFIPLDQFESIDTLYSHGDRYINKQICFIVNNYNDSDRAMKVMDSCAKAVARRNLNKFTNFTIIFYKSSKVTNIRHLKENPRDIDRYSQENDMMLSYKWVNGKFIGKTYENQ